jgi:hypothetical protein
MGSGCVGIAMHLSSLFFRNSVSFGKRIIGGHVEGNGLLVVGSTATWKEEYIPLLPRVHAVNTT